MSVCEEEEMRTAGCIFSRYTISDVYSVKTRVKLYSLSYILIPAKCLCLWLRKLHRKKKPTAVRIVSHRFVTVLFISNKIQHFLKKIFHVFMVPATRFSSDIMQRGYSSSF